MKHIAYTFALSCCIVLFFACGEKQTASGPADSAAQQPDTVVVHVTGFDTKDTSANDEMQPFYLVVADTGRDYFELRKQMLRISETAKLQIDSLGRFYNPKKKQITLPEDDIDEMYAGEYFPRRLASESMSLEQYDAYVPKSTPETFALVAGMYENRRGADSLARVLKPANKKTFVLETMLFIGCMH
jgi:hypothetical protein